MAASIHDLSRVRAHRLARQILARQAEIGGTPPPARTRRERDLDLEFDRLLHAAEHARAQDGLTRAIARACLTRAVWRSAADMGIDPADAADGYAQALCDLANVVHSESRRRARR